MNDAEFQKLLDAESPIAILASKRKRLFSALIAVLLGAMAFGRNDMVIFTLCMLFMLIMLGTLRYPITHRIVLNAEGFIIAIGEREMRSHYWKDVSEFKSERSSNVIFFNDSSKSTAPSKFKRLWVGYNNSLDNAYAIKTKQLVQLMNHWRERALAGK